MTYKYFDDLTEKELVNVLNDLEQTYSLVDLKYTSSNKYHPRNVNAIVYLSDKIQPTCYFNEDEEDVTSVDDLQIFLECSDYPPF